MKFEYPIKLTDEGAQYETGKCNQFGFFPIGRLNSWHGGIHVEGTDKEIRAIADGEVIAYRLPKQYSKETIIDKTYEYSNGFILIRHYYKSPNNQELTFYSLYMHLMSKDELEAKKKKVPNIFAKKVFQVSANKPLHGLDAFSLFDSKDTTLIPQGAIIELDESTSIQESTGYHWSQEKGKQALKYKKIKYKSREGKVFMNLLIPTAGNRIQVILPYTNRFKILSKENEDKSENRITGALERKAAQSDSEILRVIPKGTEIEIEPDKDNTWGKVKYKAGSKPSGPSGFVKITDLEMTATFDGESCILDSVKSCVIPVKAGELIGYTGKFGFEQQASYCAAHVEVFTGDDVAPFLSDLKNDGEKEKGYFKLQKEAVLKKALPYKLAKDTSVKIVSERGAYTQIKVGSLEKEAYKEVDGEKYLDYQKEGKYYYIVEKHFETINCIFNEVLSKQDKLFYVKLLEGHNRLLRYDYPVTGEKYWVPSSAVKREEIVATPPATPLPTVNSIPPAGYPLNNVMSADATTAIAPAPAGTPSVETATAPAAPASAAAAGVSKKTTPTNKAILIADVDELYLEAPAEGVADDKVTEELILGAGDFKKVKDKEGVYWHLISCKCTENGKVVTKKGWIKENDSKLKKISAYNWEEFGFKVVKDQQDEFIYNADAPPSFLKDVWKQIDTDGNKVLSAEELRLAFQHGETFEKLSLLVCLHSSEWSYGGEKWPTYKSKLEALLDKGIKKEEDSTRREELKNKKKAVLDAIEARVKDLSWWQKIKPAAKKSQGVLPDKLNAILPDVVNKAGKAVVDLFNDEEETSNTTTKPATENCETEEKPKGPTPFPVSNPKVYHFHPIAFVRQMRKLASDRAPWMKFAIGEIGVEEIYGIENNNLRIIEYHTTAGYTERLMGRKVTDDYIGDIKDPWCGSFVYWCLLNSGISKEKLNKTGYNAFSWQNWGVKCERPAYGALAVLTYSHVAFVAGVKGNKIVLLGGNQTGGDKNTYGKVCYNTADPSQIKAYRFPSDYLVLEEDFQLKEIQTDAKSDNLQSSR